KGTEGLLMLRVWFIVGLNILLLFGSSMSLAQKRSGKAKHATQAGTKGEVRLITLEPGHFHASLVQKTMYPAVSPVVWVYAPAGPDLDEHLKRVEAYNARPENPTGWQEKLYTGSDFFERMLAERPGNVVVIAGNNREKTDFI